MLRRVDSPGIERLDGRSEDRGQRITHATCHGELLTRAFGGKRGPFREPGKSTDRGWREDLRRQPPPEVELLCPSHGQRHDGRVRAQGDDRPAGTEELYLGRRLASQVLPVTSVRALAGLPDGAALPAEGSRDELALANQMSDALAAVLGPAVEALHPWTVDPAAHPRRLRKRLTWLLLRPGRLDRDG